MYKKATTLFMRCETPMHVGSGDSLGVVDLPIQRERHTSFPKIEASSLKGALRERFEQVYTVTKDRINLHLAFGYDPSDEKDGDVTKEFGSKKDQYAEQYSGALGFTDARLLFFPLKSMKGVYAMATCPLILNKLAQELKMVYQLSYMPQSVENLIKSINNLPQINDSQIICNGNYLTLKNTHVVLEEYAFNVQNEDIKDLAEQLSSITETNLSKRIVILSDNDFKDFTNLSTEVITRTKIDNATGTVAQGQLFTEEFLPTESILYSLIFASPIFQKKDTDFNKNAARKSDAEAEEVLNFFKKGLDDAKYTVQIGGNYSLGKGIVKATFLN